MVVAALSAMRGIMALGHSKYGLIRSDPDVICLQIAYSREKQHLRCKQLGMLVIKEASLCEMGV